MMIHEFSYETMDYGWIFMLILSTIGIGLFISYLTKSRSNDVEDQSNESALDILEKRLARGEISQEEYKRIKRDLR